MSLKVVNVRVKIKLSVDLANENTIRKYSEKSLFILILKVDHRNLHFLKT